MVRVVLLSMQKRSSGIDLKLTGGNPSLERHSGDTLQNDGTF